MQARHILPEPKCEFESQVGRHRVGESSPSVCPSALSDEVLARVGVVRTKSGHASSAKQTGKRSGMQIDFVLSKMKTPSARLLTPGVP